MILYHGAHKGPNGIATLHDNSLQPFQHTILLCSLPFTKLEKFSRAHEICFASYKVTNYTISQK